MGMNYGSKFEECLLGNHAWTTVGEEPGRPGVVRYHCRCGEFRLVQEEAASTRRAPVVANGTVFDMLERLEGKLGRLETKFDSLVERLSGVAFKC